MTTKARKFKAAAAKPKGKASCHLVSILMSEEMVLVVARIPSPKTMMTKRL